MSWTRRAKQACYPFLLVVRPRMGLFMVKAHYPSQGNSHRHQVLCNNKCSHNMDNRPLRPIHQSRALVQPKICSRRLDHHSKMGMPIERSHLHCKPFCQYLPSVSIGKLQFNIYPVSSFSCVDVVFFIGKPTRATTKCSCVST